MASKGGVSNQTWQTKYATNMKLAYGMVTSEDTMRVLSYAQKNQSSDHNRYVFYKTGTLVAQDQEDNYDEAKHNYEVLDGQDITDFGTAVTIVPTPIDCPFWRKKYADILTQVGIEGNLIIASRSAMYKKTIAKILAPLKAFTIDGNFIQYDIDGIGHPVTIDASQVYGDDTKTFYENEEEFLDMLAELEVFSKGEGMEVKVGCLMGTKGSKVLKGYDRASDMDYITTDEFKTKLGKKLSIKKFDFMEMIPMSNFDTTFGTTKGYMVVILDRAIGYDSNQSLDSVAVQLDHRNAKFFNTTEFNASTIVDQKGVFIFKFNGTLGARIVHTKEVTA